MVPGRTKVQCKERWREALDPSIDQTNRRTGEWTADEDSELKSAVETHGGKDWPAIALLVPGRTKKCHNRWREALDPSIDQTNRRTGNWTADEESKLKSAVEAHGGKDWHAIALLIPVTKVQCNKRWREALDPSIDQTKGRTGKWTADEDSELKTAVEAHGGKDWAAIALLLAGRTHIQC
jgi:myb proto-oncogene protein